MKKIVSLISLVCLSSSIMSMDNAHPSFPAVQVSEDKTGQIQADTILEIKDVNSDDTMHQFAEKIRQATTKIEGVSTPLNVIKMSFLEQDMFHGIHKFKTVASSGMLKEGSAVLIWLASGFNCSD